MLLTDFTTGLKKNPCYKRTALNSLLKIILEIFITFVIKRVCFFKHISDINLVMQAALIGSVTFSDTGHPHVKIHFKPLVQSYPAISHELITEMLKPESFKEKLFLGKE